jgi:hypothetical protein
VDSLGVVGSDRRGGGFQAEVQLEVGRHDAPVVVPPPFFVGALGKRAQRVSRLLIGAVDPAQRPDIGDPDGHRAGFDPVDLRPADDLGRRNIGYRHAGSLPQGLQPPP